MANGYSGWIQSVNQFIEGQLSYTYTINATNVSFSNITLKLKRTNYNTGTATHGTCAYTVVINGSSYTNSSSNSITIPNNGSEVTVFSLNPNVSIPFNGNPTISIPLDTTYSISGTTLQKPSRIYITPSFSCPVSPSTINANIISWLPMAKGQSNSASPAYEIPISMKSSANGYLYMKNDVNNKWYRVGSGQISANTWIVRECGNGQSAGNNPRVYSFHLDANLNVDNTTQNLDVSYTIPAPTKSYYIVVDSNSSSRIKWRVGDSDTGKAFQLERPSGLPTSYSGYSVKVGESFSFTDNATHLYLGSTVPAASNFKCPLGTDYIFQGFSNSSESYSLNNMVAGTTRAANSYVNDGGTVYTVFKKSSTTYTINYYVDSTTVKTGTVTKTSPDIYYYGGGNTSSNTPTYTGNRTYRPSKSGYSFGGWSTNTAADCIDYKTLQDALDADYSGNLYAVWAYPFRIVTSPSSSSNLGTITGQIKDVFGNNADTFTNTTSFGPYYKDPNTGYQFTVNKNSNVSSYIVTIKENGTIVETLGPYTSNQTIGYKYTKSKDTVVTVIWQNDITFYYGNSNGQSSVVKGIVNNSTRTEWIVTTPSATSNLTGSWTQIGWIPSQSASTENKINCNTEETVSQRTYYALYSRNLQFKSGLPGNLNTTTSTQLRSGSTYGQIQTPVPSSISYWGTKLGWRTDTTATTQTYNSSSNISYSNTGTTFYAVYSRNITFKYFPSTTATTTTANTNNVQYLNSGNSTSSSITSKALYTQSNYSWTPLGWRTDSSASTATTSQTGTTTISINPSYNTNQISYNAVYNRSPKFTYNRNGGSTTPSASTATTPQYYNANNNTASIATIITRDPITKSGSVFSGWALDSTSSSTVYQASTSYEFPARTWSSTATRTLYAIWDKASYLITLNKNGGTNGSSSTLAQYNENMPTIDPPSRIGYKFLGYYLPNTVWQSDSSMETSVSNSNGVGIADYTFTYNGIILDIANPQIIIYNNNANNEIVEEGEPMYHIYSDRKSVDFYYDFSTSAYPRNNPFSFEITFDYQTYGTSPGTTQYYNSTGNPTISKYDKNYDITLYAKWQFRGNYIYKNSTDKWVKVVPFVYDGSTWREAQPFVYTSNGWKSLVN